MIATPPSIRARAVEAATSSRSSSAPLPLLRDGNRLAFVLLVAVWLAGIIVSLVGVGGYLDIALRDFGLLVGALALSALAFARRRS